MTQFTVTLSHQIMAGGTRTHKAGTIEEAKRTGDVQFANAPLPVGRFRGAEHRILVRDEAGNLVASRLLGEGNPWKDEPVGWQEWPKMLHVEGREIIVNSREEEEAALAPVAEAPVKKRARS
jgi:hypothetical protein